MSRHRCGRSGPGAGRPAELYRPAGTDVSDEQTELICTLNLGVLTGVLTGLAPDEPQLPRLDPRPGWCCVRLAASSS